MLKFFGCCALSLSLSLQAVDAQDMQTVDAALQVQNDSSEAVAEKLDESKIVFNDAKAGDPVTNKVDQVRFKPAVRPRSFILPVALIGAGSACLINDNTRRINEYAKNGVYRPGYEDRYKIDDYTMVAPAVAVYALNLAGIKGRNNFVDRSIILGMSTLLTNSVVQYTKRLTAITRPDNSNTESFPSGHTASAFSAAEFMRQEYKDVSPWYGVAGYASAFATGYLRMYHDKHWLNDVMVGAGVGILSTRFSYWLYPKLKKAILPKSKGATLIAPAYNNGAVGVSVVHSFN